MSRRLLAPLLALVLASAGCAPPAADDGETMVFAAASLADVLPEVGRDYAEREGIVVRFSFGSSSALARQIAAGAPAELFVTADPNLIRAVGERLRRGTRVLPLATNELVLVVSRDTAWPEDGLRGVERLAVGDWRAEVPVGLRARDWLEARGEWSALEDRLAPCADARATLAAVVSGAAPAGIVYATDAAADPRVRVVERAGAAGPLTSYLAVPLDRPGEEARAFAAFLTGPEAREAFRRHGFGPPAPPAGSGT